MYINKIDELVDKIIDDFYNNLFKKKDFSKISKEHNFVKYQLNINNILADYVKTINKKEIKELLDSEDNVIKIIDIVKRYLAYYLFLMIGYFYEGKPETYINNIIEFTKNQSTFNYKINNFFNAENNSILIKYFGIVKNTMLLLELEPSKIQIAINKPEFKETIEFLNSLGQEFVIKNFKMENLGGNKEEQSHNIIKTIIVNELYYKMEKKDVYDIISSAEKKEGEFTFIDIVVPGAYYIDYNAIEDVLTKNEIRAGYAGELYKFIMDNEHKFKFEKLKADDKILFLLNNKIIVPIVDDFLLYHKDNEKYEKSHNHEQSKYKKKEDTKIRYIVSKIDNVSEYYSENIKKNPTLLKNIEKQFYAPLAERRAILVNNNEEIKIINKLHNQGRRSIENNEYYNDLMNYRQYPYINFKEFQKYGFSLQLNSTIDVVRRTSFENTSSRNYLQLRIGSKDQLLNIVGAMIPSQSKPMACIKTMSVISTSDISKRTNKKKNAESHNGYKITSKFLRHVTFKNKKHRTSIYWTFDPNTDVVKADKYEQLSKLSSQDDIKLIVSRVYDDVLLKIYDHIIYTMDKYKDLSFYDAHRIVKMHEKMSFNIPRTNELYSMIEKFIYQEKYEKSIKQYDKNEDKFGGLFGNIIKLPTHKNDSSHNSHKIKIIQDFILDDIKLEKTDAEKIGAICQHFISWDNITALRKNSPTDYTSRLYDFISQYVMENNDQDYVCKSCGTQLNIKKYITDGVYDKDSDKFVTFNMPMEIPLEDIPEYEKYKTAIRIIDKQLENMASIASIPFYVGTSTTIKSRRKGIVKNIIDMLLIHNKNMNKKYKERHDSIDKMYGVNKELTNMFVFELDNSIFVYSSKDKDFYKPIKHNNIIVYMMLLLLLEVNKSQLLYMNNDKTCNYFWFDKYGHYFFDNLKIIINDNGDTAPLKNYKILCYLIYYTACLVTKYKMWYFESDNEKIPKKKLIPLINKVIIHTFVDILNSVLEINKKTNKHFIYTSISNRFFLQLNSLYKDSRLSNILKRADTDKMSALFDKKKFIVSKIKPLELTGEFMRMKLDSNNFNKCRVAKYFFKRRTLIKHSFQNANNITNCLDGSFHQWKPSKNELECIKCNKKMNTIKLDDKESSVIAEQIKYQRLRKLAAQFCKSGELHSFAYSVNEQCNVCKKCKYSSVNKMTKSDLDQIEEYITKVKKAKEQHTNLQNDTRNEKHARYEHAVLNQLDEEYNKTIKNGDLFYHVNEFISLIQSTIGKDVNINNDNIFIKHDAYIIDHNHNGQPYDKPIIITDSDKIIFKRNHHFYGTDVLFYTNQKGNKIDVFYDATSFILLGHKESNKDFVKISSTNKHITVSYSLDSRIKLLGHSFKYIDIHERVENFQKNYKNVRDDFIIKNIVADINRVRIIRLKRVIADIQRYMYRLIYNFEEKSSQEDDVDLSKNFMNKYYKKLNNIKIWDENKRNKVFKDWEVIYNNVFMKSLDEDVININEEDKFVSVNELSKHDHSGNLILFYIVKEMGKLIEYNNNKFTKATIVFFLIDIINRSFGIYNNDIMLKNNEIKRFSYIIKSNRFIHDIEQKGHGLEGQTEGFYGEYKDEEDKDDPDAKEQLEVDQEEQDALDMDTEIDYEAGIDNYTF